MKHRSTRIFIAAMASVSLGACTSWLYGEQESQPTASGGQSAPQAQHAQGAVPKAASERLLRNIQQQLQAKGMDPGPIDGIWGPQTQSALEQFQQDQGIQASGQINADTLAALGITGEQSASTGETAPATRSGSADNAQQQGERGAFSRADQDNDGSLDRKEYQAALKMREQSGASSGGSSASSGSSSASIGDGKPTFDNLDANGDGQLTLAESAADTRISRDFKRADENNDNRLQREEFEAALKNQNR